MKIKTTTIKDLDNGFIYKMKELIDNEDNVILTRFYNRKVGYRTVKISSNISPIEEIISNYELDQEEDPFYERQDNIDFEEAVHKNFENKKYKMIKGRRSVK